MSERLGDRLTAIRNFVITFLLSLLIFGLIGYGLLQFGSSAFKLGASGGGSDPSSTDNTVTTGPNSSVTPPVYNVKGESFTFLFVITDYLPDVYDDYDVSEENQTAEGFPLEPRQIETDTILLIRFDKETGQCVFSAVPSITQIRIEGLNAQLKDLYTFAGIEALTDKISSLTGLMIDYYAVATYDDMIDLVDGFGGITYYVPEDMHQVDEVNGLNINLRRGSQTLDGKKATDMLRYSLYSDGEASQRKCAVDFMMALTKKILTEVELRDAAVTYLQYAPLFETNFTLEALTANAELIFSYDKMTVRSYSYPGTVIGSGESAYFTPNTVSAVEYFSQFKFKG